MASMRSMDSGCDRMIHPPMCSRDNETTGSRVSLRDLQCVARGFCGEHYSHEPYSGQSAPESRTKP